MKIFIIRLFDWIILLTALSLGLIALLSPEHRMYALIGFIVGLGIVHQFGQWSINKNAELKYNLRRKQRSRTED